MANDFDFRPRINFPTNAFENIPSQWGGGLQALVGGLEKGQSAAQALQKKRELEAALESFSQQYQDDSGTVKALGPVMQANPELAEKLLPELMKAKFKDKDYDTKRTYQFLNIMDDQGRPAIGRGHTGAGTLELPGKEPGTWENAARQGAIRGFSPQFRNDPVSGALVRTDAAGGVRGVGSPGFSGIGNKPEDAMLKLRMTSPVLADRFDAILDETNPAKNEALKQAVAATRESAKVKQILSDPKPSSVALNSLGFSFAIMSGSNSQLSDAERNSFAEPLGFINAVVNKGYKFTVGDFSPKMRRDLTNLANKLEAKSKIQAERIIGTSRRKARSSMGKFYSSGLDKAFPSLDEMVVSEGDINSMTSGGGLTTSDNSDISTMSTEELRKIAAGK